MKTEVIQMYLTQDEYLDFGGTIEDDVLFSRLEYKARKLIDTYTLNRLDADTANCEEVKRCMVELIEVCNFEVNQDSFGIGIASVSNDGVSISYNGGSSGNSPAVAVKNKIFAIIEQYLLGVTVNGESVLFRGIDL